MDIYINTQRGESFKAKLLNPQHCQIPVVTELVFNTSYYGHQETLTDPSYKGQTLLYSFPLTGAIGANLSCNESSKIHMDAIIVHAISSISQTHHEQNETLITFCNNYEIPIIEIQDQRELTLCLREHGETYATISYNQDHYPAQELIRIAINKQKYTRSDNKPLHISRGHSNEHVGIIDFGVKNNIIKSCVKRNADVTIFSESVTLQDLKKNNIDRVIFSNGPGNPNDYISNKGELLSILNNYPTLGICLGHQIICLLMGLETKKMKYGHRGVNHPVKNTQTNKISICSQNHGHEVIYKEGHELKVLFINLIDQSIEGVFHQNLPIITTQFHPESNPGPRDTNSILITFLT